MLEGFQVCRAAMTYSEDNVKSVGLLPAEVIVPILQPTSSRLVPFDETLGIKGLFVLERVFHPDRVRVLALGVKKPFCDVARFSNQFVVVSFGQQEDIPYFDTQSQMAELFRKLADLKSHVGQLLFGQQARLGVVTWGCGVSLIDRSRRVGNASVGRADVWDGVDPLLLQESVNEA